jgi:hypothetical protein
MSSTVEITRTEWARFSSFGTAHRTGARGFWLVLRLSCDYVPVPIQTFLASGTGPVSRTELN